LSLADLRQAIQLRHPNCASTASGIYLSVSQKELVEFGYTPEMGSRHCLGFLPPGSGKSEVYLIPTIARQLSRRTKKLIIHVSPYSFLTGYLFSHACTAVEKLGMSEISILSFTGSEIHEGVLPAELQNKETLPQLLFLNLDAMYNLFFFFPDDVRSWTSSVDKIVLDEIHTIYSEMRFRQKYKVYESLAVLGIPIVGMSGSVPLFAITRLARHLCLSVLDDLSDVKVIQGGDVIGEFPPGFKIQVKINEKYLSKVANFVIKRLGPRRTTMECAVHVFVAEKNDGNTLLSWLGPRYDCRLVT
jgi:hypothetical protein